MAERINTIIVILGPTACGKTATALKLSKLIPIEIISADSRQVYKYLDIGTAKPSKTELASVPHHFIDILQPDEYFSAGIFADLAEKTACEIISREAIPVVVGGSGLYIQALCEGFFEETPSENKSQIREGLINRVESEGIEILFEELKSIDPISAAKYNDKNPRRIIRAMEYFLQTGTPFSLAHQQTQKQSNFNSIYFGIEHERSVLYNRINQRTEEMWANGIVGETQRVLEMGYSTELNSLNTVGYKECIDFLSGKLNEREAIEKIKQNTRHYAKRQLTWFRRNTNINWLHGEAASICKQIIGNLK